MPSSLFTPGSASTSVSGGSTDWTNPNGAYGTNDASPANCSFITGVQSTYLIAVGGFSGTPIPAGATIVGIQIGGKAWQSSDMGGTPTISAFSYTVGSKGGSDLAGQGINTAVGSGIVTGSSSTLPPGLAGVTPADCNGTLSVGFQAASDGSGSQFAINLDDIRLTVYYTIPGPPVGTSTVILQAVNRASRF